MWTLISQKPWALSLSTNLYFERTFFQSRERVFFSYIDVLGVRPRTGGSADFNFGFIFGGSKMYIFLLGSQQKRITQTATVSSPQAYV